MNELYIELTGERRRDGSVLVRSPDLPLFCVVGGDEKAALDLALQMLPEYLKANVPEFVEVRSIRSAKDRLVPAGENILPAHIIATKGPAAHATAGTTKNG